MAGPYPYNDTILYDEASGALAERGAQTVIFAIGDPLRTPLEIRDLSGIPLPNPYVLGESRMNLRFIHETLDEVAWGAGEYTGVLTSYQGIKDAAAQSAQGAAEAAESAGLVLSALEAGELVGEQGPQGIPGTPGANGANVLPTQEAVQQALTSEGPAKAYLAVAVEAGTASKLDKAEAPGVATRLRESSAAYIDTTTGQWWMGGAQVPVREPIKSASTGAVTTTALTVNPAHTNALAPIAGAVVGTVGSGGAFPSGWANQVSGVSKQIVSFTASEIVVQYGTSPDRFFGGFNTSSVTVTGEQIHVFDIEFHDDGGNRSLYVSLSLMDGSTRIGEQRIAYIGEPKRRVAVRFPAQATARAPQFRILGLTPEDSAGRAPRLTLSNYAVYATSEVGAVPSRLPEWSAGTTAARDITLAVPAGDYVLTAATTRGVLTGVATVAGTAGLNLRAALGGAAKLTKLAVVAASDYTPGMGDFDFPRSIHAAAGLTAQYHAPMMDGANRALNSADGPGIAAPYAPRAVQVVRPGRVRFHIKSGDQAPGDGPTQERAEIVTNKPLPYGTPVWVSDSFKVDEYDYTGVEQYTLIHQIQSYLAGAPTVSPEYSFSVKPMADGTIRAYMLVRSNKDTGTVTGSWETFIRRGEWHRYVARIVFNKTGNGQITIWFDGVQSIDLTVPIGYDKPEPAFKFGTYANADTKDRIVEHANVEYGTDDLTSRITKPLPI